MDEHSVIRGWLPIPCFLYSISRRFLNFCSRTARAQERPQANPIDLPGLWLCIDISACMNRVRRFFKPATRQYDALYRHEKAMVYKLCAQLPSSLVLSPPKTASDHISSCLLSSLKNLNESGSSLVRTMHTLLSSEAYPIPHRNLFGLRQAASSVSTSPRRSCHCDCPQHRKNQALPVAT